jgi:hypothetical protein
MLGLRRMNKQKQTVKEEQRAHAEQSAHFHWEFLRRNDRYILAYNKFIRKYPDCPGSGWDPQWLAEESIKRGQDPRMPSREKFIARFSRDLDKFRKKFGIDPTDPNQRFSPFFGECTSWVIGWTEKDSPAAPLHVVVDRTGPLHEVMAQFESLIRRCTISVPGKSRHRFDQYPFYLEVNDLTKSGKTDPEIAPIFESHNLHFQDPVKRVSEYRNKAKVLIKKATKQSW